MTAKLTPIPFSEIKTPADGKICICNRYWLVLGLHVFKSPDFGNYIYHRNEEVLRALHANLINNEGAIITHIPVAYVSKEGAI